MHPRTDKQEIAAHHEGLIVCSACLGGEVPRKILDGDIDGAFVKERLVWVNAHPTA